jgi:hypothetical protein
VKATRRADICNRDSMIHLNRMEDYMTKHRGTVTCSTKGAGIYVPPDDFVTCEECGKRVPEREASMLVDGCHPVCSTRCGALWWGVDEADLARVL